VLGDPVASDPSQPFQRSPFSGTFPTQHLPRTLRLTLGYRGTRYAGWAKQPPSLTGGKPTLQAVLEQALTDLLGHSVTLTAAGRTDAGVHADAQVVSFATSSTIPAQGVAGALAHRLPDDVWALHAVDAPAGFDARYSARGRWYRYRVWQGRTPPLDVQGFSLPHPGPLDVTVMRRASHHLLGRHDCASLVGGWGRDARPGRTTDRTVFAADWIESASPLLIFEIGADAFLRQMVRTIVGTLLWVGEGRWSEQQFVDALAARDRRAAGPAAPAIGLTLNRIEY